jgi:hypothetical protein
MNDTIFVWIAGVVVVGMLVLIVIDWWKEWSSFSEGKIIIMKHEGEEEKVRVISPRPLARAIIELDDEDYVLTLKGRWGMKRDVYVSKKTFDSVEMFDWYKIQEEDSFVDYDLPVDP